MVRSMFNGSPRAFSVDPQQLALLLLALAILAVLLLCPTSWPCGRAPTVAPPIHQESLLAAGSASGIRHDALGSASGTEQCGAVSGSGTLLAGAVVEGEAVSMLTLFVAGILTKCTASLLSSNQMLWVAAA
mmetsp:Transcript_72126/g.204773  ORF Transcript_72126/g.204773 Transcript_72126/m.204773 type:complete len:131 (-) Transcript_72126:276-668(-)